MISVVFQFGFAVLSKGVKPFGNDRLDKEASSDTNLCRVLAQSPSTAAEPKRDVSVV